VSATNTKNEKENLFCPLYTRTFKNKKKTFSFPYEKGPNTYTQQYLLAVAVAVAVVVVVDIDNVDFFVDVNELMNNLSVENKKELVDDELNFHIFVELVLFQHYFQHMLNLQIHNADASSNYNYVQRRCYVLFS
jgi:hypothetical protein